MKNRTIQAVALLLGMLSATTAFGYLSPVNLRSAGTFAILAKTGVSATGVTAIVGDVGISPAAATYVTGFGLIASPSTTFSTSSLVTGKIYAADYTDPTPTTLTTAIGDMQTAYTDAAGRLTPDFVEKHAGDLTGKTLTPGLYTWSTGVNVSAAGVTIAGTASDVWIFQVAQNLELASGAMVILSGGARAANIFWQVAGQVTIGTTAAMKGILLCQTAIVMSTGATLDGRALAQTAVTLNANSVVMPSQPAVVAQAAATNRSRVSLVNARQSIVFSVPSSGRATLTILNAHGQEIAVLFSGEAVAGRSNHVRFDVGGLAEGLYFSRVACNREAMQAKLALVK
jgi:hypothetical protein